MRVLVNQIYHRFHMYHQAVFDRQWIQSHMCVLLIHVVLFASSWDQYSHTIFHDLSTCNTLIELWCSDQNFHVLLHFLHNLLKECSTFSEQVQYSRFETLLFDLSPSIWFTCNHHASQIKDSATNLCIEIFFCFHWWHNVAL